MIIRAKRSRCSCGAVEALAGRIETSNKTYSSIGGLDLGEKGGSLFNY
jgi:hypothetical protein